MTVIDAGPTATTTVEEVFAHALDGERCHLMLPEGGQVRLPVDDWTRDADATDRRFLDLCRGATIDIGCGPGRLTVDLAGRGHLALGIDVVREAVGHAQGRGGTALHRDVFGPLPGEGRWSTALLADGNIGIGGRPVELLRRVHRLLAPGGRVVAEVAAPGVRTHTFRARLECACARSESFSWSVVGVDGIAEIAAVSGFTSTATMRHGGRWCAVLEP